MHILLSLKYNIFLFYFNFRILKSGQIILNIPLRCQPRSKTLQKEANMTIPTLSLAI